MQGDKYNCKNNITKSYISKILILLIAMVLLIPASFAVTISPSDKSVVPGQSFDLNISIDPQGTPISGAQLNLAFNRSVLRVNSVTEGNLFKQKGNSTFFSSGIIDNSTGTAVNIFNVILGKSNVSTPGTFIIVNITAIGSSGTSRINLSNVKVSDPIGILVPANVTNGTVSIISINSPPVLTAIGNKIINEGQTLNFIISASDPEGVLLTFSSSNLPSGASFNTATRTFVWTPDYTQSGTYPNIRFGVSDGIYTVYENITITVNNVNRLPTIALTPANGSTFNHSDIVQINITANDPDNDPLSYILKIDGVQVSTSSGYAWVTNGVSSGNHTIEASVSDGKATVTRTIIVNIIYPRQDVNENGVVDIGDLAIIGQHINETNYSYPRYDVNMDGEINIIDIRITALYLG